MIRPHHPGRLLLFLLVLLCVACDPGGPHLEPLSKAATILAFGDSLTYGTGASHESAYPAHLQTLLSRTVINAGKPGETSRFGLGRLPALLKQHQPELLILCHGGNDILRGYDRNATRNNLQKMIDLARNSNTQVVLISVPEFGIFLSPAPLYSELAESNRLPVENEALSDILKNHELKSDQIHPNAEGYRILAQRIYALLRQSGAIH